MEKFKDIVGYEGLYKIGNFGTVVSLSRLVNRKGSKGKKLRINECSKKPSKTTKGNYITYWVALSKEGIQKKFYIHRLVATYFLKNPLNKKEVNHKDNNPTNNNVNNLEWMTHDENMKYAMKQNRIRKGETSGMSKLNDEKVREILENKTSYKNLAKKFEVSYETIFSVRRGQSWKHVKI